MYYICSKFYNFYDMEKTKKRQRFEKVASRRVQKVIDYLALLQNCANRNNYDYNEQDVEHMFTEITKALKETKAAYGSELGKANKSGFSFS